MIIWIHKTDLANYRTLMGPDAPILEERELDIKVQFNDSGMRTWVDAGFWYTFD